MEASIELRPAVAADDEFLRLLYATTRADELAATGWDERQVVGFLRMQWEAQRADYRGRYPDSDHEIVLVGGEAVGRLWVDRGHDEIYLLDIALLPAAQGRRIGARLLRRLQVEAAARNVPLRHSVARDNERAIRLYGELGFAVVSEEHPTHLAMQWVSPAVDEG